MRLVRWLIAIPLALVLTAAMFLAINARVAPEPFLYTKPGEPTRVYVANEEFEERIFCECSWLAGVVPAETANSYTKSEKAAKKPPETESPLHRDEDEIDRDLLSLDLGAGRPRACDGKDYLIDYMAPAYPAACADKGAQGSVTVRYDISVEGRVQNARVVESPDACFNKAVLTAVNKRRFPPVCDDSGKPYARYGVEETLTFQLAE